MLSTRKRRRGRQTDIVGDNVHDIAGMGADLFGSFAETTCAALVLVASSNDSQSSWKALMCPVLISSLEFVVGIARCGNGCFPSAAQLQSGVSSAAKLQSNGLAVQPSCSLPVFQCSPTAVQRFYGHVDITTGFILWEHFSCWSHVGRGHYCPCPSHQAVWFSLWEHLSSCFSYMEAGLHCCAPRTPAVWFSPWGAFSCCSHVERGHYCPCPSYPATTLRAWVLISLDPSQTLRARRWFSLRPQMTCGSS